MWHRNESCHTRTCFRRFRHVDCHLYSDVMSHRTCQMRCVRSYRYEPCHIRTCFRRFRYSDCPFCSGARLNAVVLMDLWPPCDMTHSYVTCRIPTWLDSFCYMTHSHVTCRIHMGHDTWLIHHGHAIECVVTEWPEVVGLSASSWYITYVTWLTHMWHALICDMTHSYVTWLTPMWHDPRICAMTRLYTVIGVSASSWYITYVTWLTHMWHDSLICDMTHIYETCHDTA